MVNCAIAGVDWRDLTVWQYQAVLSEWGDRHSPDADKPAPDPVKVARVKRAMAAQSVH